jgi:hypothetical protein
VRCRADGQARAVAALWLGAAATPDGARLLRDVVADAGPASTLTFAGWDDPPMWGVRFKTADARAALNLLERPTADVTRALADRWPSIVDPHTPASALGTTGAEHSATGPGFCG